MFVTSSPRGAGCYPLDRGYDWCCVEILHWMLGSTSSSLCDCHSLVGDFLGLLSCVAKKKSWMFVCEKALLLLEFVPGSKEMSEAEARSSYGHSMYVPPHRHPRFCLGSSPCCIPFCCVCPWPSVRQALRIRHCGYRNWSGWAATWDLSCLCSRVSQGLSPQILASGFVWAGWNWSTSAGKGTSASFSLGPVHWDMWYWLCPSPDVHVNKVCCCRTSWPPHVPDDSADYGLRYHPFPIVCTTKPTNGAVPLPWAD